MQRNVLLVTGIGGMGLAVARRLGSGRHVILADYSQQALDAATLLLRTDGFDVEGFKIDVSEYESVVKLAQHTIAAGHLDTVVHTAGVGPSQATPDRVLEINLLGTANVIEAFSRVVNPGSSLICYASIAGHWETYSEELTRHLATAPLSDLLDHPELKLDHFGDRAGGQAYRRAKRGNIVRVQAAAPLYGQRGARINSVSPGTVLTPMVQLELTKPHGPMIQGLIDKSPAKRFGTAEDIAKAVAFLASPDSDFITGSDLVVDGGQHSARVWLKAE